MTTGIGAPPGARSHHRSVTASPTARTTGIKFTERVLPAPAIRAARRQEIKLFQVQHFFFPVSTLFFCSGELYGRELSFIGARPFFTGSEPFLLVRTREGERTGQAQE
ncbi:hypothetical protein GGP80_000436 [Salinibacter ruber]|uniref:Uncharacterized protein n=1 Tax=Salinibacter ruber TaxID=146919 RepID=A0A9X2TFU9_9BACT|nr:hypothetical protein [Salinibacter ruber]MBB4060235.1 hypothetical protein [Salinibacter ruber]MBB4069838.1 hypothetical protein [Salinibacter ruber]MCS3658643.1 hypothetical protein [Salinibacter ruber]MCS3670755.1 hypothetical protein [Salinibacter ruber]MCS3708446.1 hypothetical protein [Salinibacter ruber]